MSALLIEYGLFLLKVLTLLAALGIALALVVAGIGSAVSRGRDSTGGGGGKLRIRKYNERLDDMRESLSISLLDPGARKQAEKDRRARDKAERKAARAAAKKAKKQRGKGETIAPDESRPRTFVLDFLGDIRASQVDALRREVTAILTTATSEDEVVVRLDSGGGTVTGYGLGATQLDRIRHAKVPLVVCVDQVAASGGYMMACVSDRLIAAPFAMLGSIGVVAQVPNFHRLLKDWNIDVELLTAGKFKRTLTLFGENTDEGREKVLQDIERIHAQFKAHVDRYRPKLSIEQVSTGEIWSGEDVLAHGLADELGTSDDYLIRACEERAVLLVGWQEKRRLMQRLSGSVEEAVDRFALRWFERLRRTPLP